MCSSKLRVATTKSTNGNTDGVTVNGNAGDDDIDIVGNNTIENTTIFGGAGEDDFADTGRTTLTDSTIRGDEDDDVIY